MNQTPLVFKFGGASIASPNRMRNIASIIEAHANKPLAVVVSAIGKTTNALEEVVIAYHQNHIEKAKQSANEILTHHIDFAKELLNKPQFTLDQLNNLFVEIEWVLEDEIQNDFSYTYDQIVSIGELASTTILNAYLAEQSIPSQWLDARSMIKTDDVFQHANINWPKTEQLIQNTATPVLQEGKVVITQGFIGSNETNDTTTLGREGSDFTGSILANCLSAESLTIWKDVPGVLNADPKWMQDTVKLDEISYKEAVEMTFYGAKVIHPKTIKPLRNKHIPLFVRSFLESTKPGSQIHQTAKNNFERPVFVLKENQVLMNCQTKNFDFFDTVHITEVLHIFDQEHCDINLLQNGAVQCSFVFDNDVELIENLNAQLSKHYEIEWTDGLELLTIRHYDIPTLNQFMEGKNIVLVQRTENTFQAVYQSK